MTGGGQNSCFEKFNSKINLKQNNKWADVDVDVNVQENVIRRERVHIKRNF